LKRCLVKAYSTYRVINYEDDKELVLYYVLP